MARTRIEQLLWLLDESFDGNVEHSLLANLRAVSEREWQALPGGGKRSVAEVVAHVGSCYFMYDDYAFRTASLRWDRPPVEAPRPWTLAAAEPWLREGLARLTGSVGALAEDAELERLRRLNRGDEAPTRWILSVMIEHNLYHAGEINHIRALLQDDDAWPRYGGA